MVSTRNEDIQAVNQGECTECGSSNDNYKVLDSSQSGKGISYDIVCECGEETTVHITETGLSTDDSITYRDASWNYGVETQEGEDGEEDEAEESMPDRGETERMQ